MQDWMDNTFALLKSDAEYESISHQRIVIHICSYVGQSVKAQTASSELTSELRHLNTFFDLKPYYKNIILHLECGNTQQNSYVTRVGLN